METIYSFTKIKYKNLFYKAAERSKNFTAADCKTESTSSLISWSAKSLVRPLPIQRHCSIDLKGNSGRKKFSSNERAWKMQKNEPSLTSMRQMVLEISHFKVRNLSKMDVAIL